MRDYYIKILKIYIIFGIKYLSLDILLFLELNFSLGVFKGSFVT